MDVGGELRPSDQLIERRVRRVDDVAEVERAIHFGVTRIDGEGREKEPDRLAHAPGQFFEEGLGVRARDWRGHG